MGVLVSDVNVDSVGRSLQGDGFVCLENAIDKGWLTQAQEYVHSLIDQKGERYFALNWPSRDEGAPIGEITADNKIRSLLGSLVRFDCPQAGIEDEIYNVLRVVAGDKSGDRKSLKYHYDNTVITALVPIVIPVGEPRRAGELLAYPNRRGYRSTAPVNIIEKAVVQSDWYRERFTRKLPDGDIPQIRMLQPGNMYLFWGYRTYHANFPVTPGMTRATLLLHYGNPHPNSFLLKLLKARNLRRERRNLATGGAG
jgi:hypothetical protein